MGLPMGKLGINCLVNLVLWFSGAGCSGLNDQEFSSGISKEIDKKNKKAFYWSTANYVIAVNSKLIDCAIDGAINPGN